MVPNGLQVVFSFSVKSKQKAVFFAFAPMKTSITFHQPQMPYMRWPARSSALGVGRNSSIVTSWILTSCRQCSVASWRWNARLSNETPIQTQRENVVKHPMSGKSVPLSYGSSNPVRRFWPVENRPHHSQGSRDVTDFSLHCDTGENTQRQSQTVWLFFFSGSPGLSSDI